MYNARLRLHGGFKMAATRVTDLLKELGLEHVANVRIGGESRHAGVAFHEVKGTRYQLVLI
jgi:hypothetical protein